LAAGFDHANLPVNFVFQGLADKTEGIHILDFGLGPKLFLASWTHADIGVTARGSFLHVDVTDARVEDDFFQSRKVFVGFLGRSDIRRTDYFNQRYPATVQIDRGLLLRIGKTLVQTLASIFLEVQPRNSNLLDSAAGWDLDPTVLSQRLIVLRDLVALGQIRIEIILAGEDRCLVYPAIYRHGGKHSELH